MTITVTIPSPKQVKNRIVSKTLRAKNRVLNSTPVLHAEAAIETIREVSTILKDAHREVKAMHANSK